MKEIRIHARAGQGAITTASLLGEAYFSKGMYPYAFPSFGAARMGAPMNAFVRVDSKPVRLRSQIYEPDYVIVQDPTLIGSVDVFAGLKKGGMVLINTEKSLNELKLKDVSNVKTIPATKIALEILGRPIPNTVMLGAFAGLTGSVSMEGIKKAMKGRFKGEIADKNIAAAEKAYNDIKKKI